MSTSETILSKKVRKSSQLKKKPTTTFVNTLLRDTGLVTVEELERCMEDRDCWHSSNALILTLHFFIVFSFYVFIDFCGICVF